MVEEYCDLPFNFGKCEEKSVTAYAACRAWATNDLPPVNITFFKNGRQRAIYIPEVLFKSNSAKKTGFIAIGTSLDPEEFIDFTGENEINFGTYGYTGNKFMNKEIIPVSGKIEKNNIYLGKDNYFSIVKNNGLIGIVSTFITFDIQEDDPDSQEPPAKEPFTDDEGEEEENKKGNSTVLDDDYEMEDVIPPSKG